VADLIVDLGKGGHGGEQSQELSSVNQKRGNELRFPSELEGKKAKQRVPGPLKKR